jgi:biotin operon repressor
VGQAKRARDAKKASKEPFATMRADALLRVVLTTSTIALRIYLLANAAWLPPHSSKSSSKSGKAILPYAAIQRPLTGRHHEAKILAERPGRSSIARGINELVSKGLLVRIKAGSRPSQAGGGRGEAAEYDLPDRHGLAAPKVQLPANIRRPHGKVRLHANAIRRDAEELPATTLKLLYYLVALKNRTDEGKILENNFFISCSKIAKELNVSASNIHKCLETLTSTDRLTLLEPGKGRRSSQYALQGRYATFKQRTSQRRVPDTTTTGMVSSRCPVAEC